ncbi:3-oxoacyl-ACP reductase FabG [Pseudoalteromonas sp. NZS127_1]|jgi:3-oxoacyl-[acyl-carrier protein] reductase|uniref:3-oxoacyl-ACP reductase FabG n=1 Tax=Pseudoalteromonas arctica TaxID=394751 RepID=A0AAP6Y3J7_9GAMM|nr:MULTISPECIES: 3-oxoacyl-ACP reductase FabG [Pseudoalteromonas]MBG9991019.1 3-oxoacyl-ACP reductase FabG [Pseudoalteromonas sp. NZS37]MBG9995095.1 3-oxoacyl-ACP reductase FabG [Pseudoalteromonas sp. NZS127_1]MBH0000448.1 3-oxoacyl-ACP reductase FabG [Pseudoalteromonas sp. NSLLW24]MBH0033309.1 3-oxoacyl-ACP reductase FabG [Pseudoalteromonas sp. NZS71_1]MBH0040972.1 3-oxoacyl-ACP reductase FabG [Pseudoalteromonas sp. SWXJZ10B]
MTKRILVTGSSRGIGKAIALKLAEQGFDIAVHCRAGVEQAQATCDEINALGRATSLLQFDVCDREQAKAQIIEDIAQHGAYYGVVCNAGITNDMAFPAMQGEDWDCVIRTGLDGFYNVVHPTVMPMVQSRKGGRIITMSSVSGIAGNRGQVNYSAAKAGIIGATKALALELAKRKITVNCVAPGLIETAMTDELPIDEMMKMIPLKRMGSVKEVAGTVAFLMSDDAAYITRQVISVNGGMV